MSTCTAAPAWRRPTRLVVLFVAALLLGAAPASAQDVQRPDELRVMSFNLRFASDTPPNSWPERRPVMRELLRHERPQLLGTQEGLYQQLRDVEADLPDHYDSIGEGREGGSAGEAMQIFYDTRRLDPLEYRHYWLSDTPDVIGSKTWGGCCPRMVTWIRFLDRVTGKQFYAVNTHFEAFDALARRLSAELLLRRAGEEFDPALPVIVTGDFNEAARVGGTVYDLLVTNGPFLDTWEEAEQRSALFATFHGYRPLVPDGDRIDWILTTPGATTSSAEILTFSKHGQFPSDHLPVLADVELP
jgi:endonuclease/exonuclease/phosphatase family metal-dependent hydrolase